MPWCPNCKTEYQEGYTTCADCGTTLVDHIDQIEQEEASEPIFYTSDEKLADKLVRFFEYSDLNSQIQYDETSELYTVTVASEDEKEARRLYEAFYFVEAKRLINERNGVETPDEVEEVMEDDDIYHNINPEDIEADAEEEVKETANEDVTEYKRSTHSATYVMKSEQYKELSSSVWVFLGFGVVGIIFVVLNILKILTLFSGIIPNLVMSVLFLGCLYIGITTNTKAKQVRSEIYEEEKLTEKINNWMKEHITDSFLSSIHDDMISEETNHIKKMDIIKEMIIKEFGSINLVYVDRLIDEFYNNPNDYEEE